MLDPDGARATFTYDANGNLTQMGDWTGTSTRGYDGRDLLTSAANPDGRRLTYTWDGAGRRETLVDPDGGTTTYVYDAAGRRTQLVNAFAETTTLVWDDAGRQVRKELDNGTWTSITYDDAGRTTAVANFKSDDSVISSFDYGYDNAGNRLSVVEAGGDRVTWTYDRTYQLLTEDRSGAGGYTHTFSYDPVGNRLTRDDGTAVTTSVYDAANRLQTAEDGSGVTTYTFDANGNQRTVETPAGDVTTYVWDYENQMASAEDAAGDVTTYTYTAAEQRVGKETDAETVKFLWDGQNIVQEYDESDVTQADHTNDPQPAPQPFGNLVSQRREMESSFYSFDALGSTRNLTDDAEVETDDYTYEAFGKVAASSGTTENPFQWVGQTGYYADEETSLYSLRRRQYGSGEGRFVSEDPDGPQLNLYRYSSNRPTLLTDPSGLDSECIRRRERLLRRRARNYNEWQRASNELRYLRWAEHRNEAEANAIFRLLHPPRGIRDIVREEPLPEIDADRRTQLEQRHQLLQDLIYLNIRPALPQARYNVAAAYARYLSTIDELSRLKCPPSTDTSTSGATFGTPGSAAVERFDEWEELFPSLDWERLEVRSGSGLTPEERAQLAEVLDRFTSTVELVGATALSLLPVVGEVIEAISIIRGKDLTDEDISLFWRIAGAVLLLVPLVDRRTLRWLADSIVAIARKLRDVVADLGSSTPARRTIAFAQRELQAALDNLRRNLDDPSDLPRRLFDDESGSLHLPSSTARRLLLGSQRGAALLRSRADELFAAAPRATGDTVAVIRGRNRVTSEERVFVAIQGSQRRMPRRWEGKLKEGEEWVPGIDPTFHAEENILRNQEFKDWDFIEGGTSRNVCSPNDACGKAIQDSGMLLGGPAFPGRQGTSSRMFWRQGG